ncbi:TRAP transporter fused permease subunit [Propylenella binzhouense]|uniref:TRAP transporter permease n=1 Tax=Propylenella binzhouense TaxID=2555902 RepID=UPI0031B63EE3
MNLAFSTGVRRYPSGRLGQAFKLYAVLVAAYTIWAAAFSTWDVLSRTIVFLSMMLVLVFPLIGHSERARADRPLVTDWLLAALAFASLVFFVSEVDAIGQRMSLFDPLPPSYWFFGSAILLMSLEAARRTVGLGLTTIVVLFVAYNLFGHLLAGPLTHGHITPGHFLDLMVFTTDGLFGAPVQVTATYAFLFVLFGTLLERAGGGEFFFDFAAIFAGRRPGGPAKVAVFSSGLFGMVSGSPTSDVVTTGSVTIPIMKRLGYSPRLAAGVEVAASTGGSILPPVMGSAVFIMVEFTGIPYVEIAVAALVPAIIYYVGIYVQVHLRSLKLGLRGLPEEQIPELAPTLKRGFLFLVPLVTLVGALWAGYTPTFVALFGAASVVAVWALRWRTFSLRALYDGAAQTTFNMVAVTGACAAAGMVIGGITMTGLAGKVSDLIALLAGSNLLLTLVIGGALTILLGMGMPTPAAYALAAALVAPTLIRDFGVPAIQAHLFLLYFAVLSAMTPPVAVAAYAAAAIADDNPMAIAFVACNLAVSAFLLPFTFIYDPGLMLIGGPAAIAGSIVSVLLAVVLISVAKEGYAHRPLGPVTRTLCALAGLAYLVPNLYSLIYGTVLLAAALVSLRWSQPGTAGADKAEAALR